MQSLWIWSCKVSLKVLYSLAPANVSALITPALSLCHCTLFHNSHCFFPLLWLLSVCSFSHGKKSHSVVTLLYSTNPSFKSASSITPTQRSPERYLARVQLAWLSLIILRGRKCISEYFSNYYLHRKSHKNVALLVTTALHIPLLYKLVGHDKHGLQYFNNCVQLHIVPATEQT